jgi:hypothetical protein
MNRNVPGSMRQYLHMDNLGLILFIWTDVMPCRCPTDTSHEPLTLWMLIGDARWAVEGLQCS